MKAGETLRGQRLRLRAVSVPTTPSISGRVSSLQTPKTADVVKWWSGYRLHGLPAQAA